MSGRHRDFLPIVLGTFALVTAYALASDIAIARIAPDHFSILYPEWLPFQEPWQHALCYGLLTGLIEGVSWGILLYWVGHYGPGPTVGPRTILLGVGAVVAITGICAWCLGAHVYSTGKLIYPQNFFPLDDKDLNVTLTVQITNYLVASCGGPLLILAIALWRRAHTTQSP